MTIEDLLYRDPPPMIDVNETVCVRTFDGDGVVFLSVRGEQYMRSTDERGSVAAYRVAKTMREVANARKTYEAWKTQHDRCVKQIMEDYWKAHPFPKTPSALFMRNEDHFQKNPSTPSNSI